MLLIGIEFQVNLLYKIFKGVLQYNYYIKTIWKNKMAGQKCVTKLIPDKACSLSPFNHSYTSLATIKQSKAERNAEYNTETSH